MRNMKIRVNGAELYYEVWGQGPAIILVHGNSETHEIFDVLIPSLAKDHTVYAVDSRCHGQSENTERISYELMCDDMIQFIKKLDIHKPILYGFSDGGVIGLMIAMKEPNLLSKLISSGADLYPTGMKLTLFPAMIKEAIHRDKVYRMMFKEPHIKARELQKIKIPTVILAGEHDAIRTSHTKKIARSIPGSILEILPGETHTSYVISSEKLYPILKKYL